MSTVASLAIVIILEQLPEKFVGDLYNSLTSEIGALTREITACCVDWDRLKGGDFYNKRLSKATMQERMYDYGLYSDILR